DWNLPQTVTVTGADDAVQDGAVAYAIVLGAASGADPGYAGMDAADVSVTNADDDVAGIVVTASALVTSEPGTSASFTMRLASQPAADVVIAPASDDPAEGVAAPASLTFTAADWNVPQTVAVTGVNDAVQDGDMPYHVILAPATSGDPHYAGM